MKTSDFDYFLPEELIAQTPIEPRDQSRLLVLNRRDGSLENRRFFEVVDYLKEGDTLVFNDSRVIPARLSGQRPDSQSHIELLLLRRLRDNTWETLARPAKRLKVGSRIEINGGSSGDGRENPTAEVIGLGEAGIRVISFSGEKLLPEMGKIPLPPYIRVPLEDTERYQTVYSRADGSVAATTAGLHFTRELLERIEAKGVRCLFATLHVGLDTFRPVRAKDPREHHIHQEYGVLSREVAEELSKARQAGSRIIGVGTTTVRLLEAAAQMSPPASIPPFEGWVSLFILPGYRFRTVDAIITNFHLPRSTLLMLVTAFAGRENTTRAYQTAIAERYRFYSFGDAMLIL